MQHQLKRYTRLLINEQCAKAGRIAVSGQNDTISSCGPYDLDSFAREILQQLNCAAVIVAEPLYPFSAFLLRRSTPDIGTLIPRDSESKSSLHDIPLIRKKYNQADLLQEICTRLHKRKGCIVEGIGMISHGTLTIEQAYIAWSSLLHATTVKYFEDLLMFGPILPEESIFLQQYKRTSLKPTAVQTPFFSPLPPKLPDEIISDMVNAGKAMVKLGLVDSFFGNISFATDDTLYISQTSARLDELSGQIDIVTSDGSSTSGLTASSELPAHQGIIRATGCNAILHGHPRFPVLMSFFASPTKHAGIEQVDGLPVVGGEGGVGGLAETLPRAFQVTGEPAIIVRGHGVFVKSDSGFGEALATLAKVEQQCRENYFKRLDERYCM